MNETIIPKIPTPIRVYPAFVFIGGIGRIHLTHCDLRKNFRSNQNHLSRRRPGAGYTNCVFNLEGAAYLDGLCEASSYYVTLVPNLGR
jgi:hypothetical protein